MGGDGVQEETNDSGREMKGRSAAQFTLNDSYLKKYSFSTAHHVRFGLLTANFFLLHFAQFIAAAGGESP